LAHELLICCLTASAHRHLTHRHLTHRLLTKNSAKCTKTLLHLTHRLLTKNPAECTKTLLHLRLTHRSAHGTLCLHFSLYAGYLSIPEGI
jgi:hypothetical protein